jgi:hypothetical protein
MAPTKLDTHACVKLRWDNELHPDPLPTPFGGAQADPSAPPGSLHPHSCPCLSFLSLAPSPSLALIHSNPSSSCSLSHVLFQSLFLSLTKVSIHSLFPSCKFVSCTSLPLSPPTCTPTCTGCFKCLLPLGVVPGQTMEVAVPAGYPQAGRISRFVVSSLQEPLSHISHHETLLEHSRV